MSEFTSDLEPDATPGDIAESANPGSLDTTDSIDSNVRYAAYANRLRTILLATHRYVAYTSDIGESFRPAVSPWLVRACYGISWGYVLGDVSYEAWKAKLRQEGRYHPGLRPWDKVPEANPLAVAAAEKSEYVDWKLVALERGLFQSIASMGLPALTIHTSVKYASQYAEKHIKNIKLKTWGPVAVGLGIVPLLPYLFDKPVEHALTAVFKQFGHHTAATDKTKLE